MDRYLADAAFWISKACLAVSEKLTAYSRWWLDVQWWLLGRRSRPFACIREDREIRDRAERRSRDAAR
ncbi:hypothetical protein OOZ54_12635 [Rhodopseudomonas palustris]|uniref:hypothetical protein n=1 Tax=Rhodopseudomonas palustris TaxID=1076 RepID=UPI0022F0C728|nr:hypothetical protein [Rhodopseudomonas palustris]WBU27541.1 hypothetical protein OOZ54_12635 [Rhodopseudomonas palustris]